MNSFQIGIPFNARFLRRTPGWPNDPMFDDFFSNFPQRTITPLTNFPPGPPFAGKTGQEFRPGTSMNELLYKTGEKLDELDNLAEFFGDDDPEILKKKAKLEEDAVAEVKKILGHSEQISKEVSQVGETYSFETDEYSSELDELWDMDQRKIDADKALEEYRRKFEGLPGDSAKRITGGPILPDPAQMPISETERLKKRAADAEKKFNAKGGDIPKKLLDNIFSDDSYYEKPGQQEFGFMDPEDAVPPPKAALPEVAEFMKKHKIPAGSMLETVTDPEKAKKMMKMWETSQRMSARLAATKSEALKAMREQFKILAEEGVDPNQLELEQEYQAAAAQRARTHRTGRMTPGGSSAQAEDVLGLLKGLGQGGGFNLPKISPKGILKGLLKASPAMVAEVAAFEGGKMAGQALSPHLFEPLPGPGGPVEGLLPDWLSWVDPTAGGETPYVPNPSEVSFGKPSPGEEGFDDQMALDLLMQAIPSAFGRQENLAPQPVSNTRSIDLEAAVEALRAMREKDRENMAMMQIGST